MAHSTRLRLRNSGKGSKKRDSKRPSRAAKKRKHNYEEEEPAVEEAEETLFKVEKIVGIKADKNGAPLYKTRWKGYSASDDTWEPAENVASTGHIDRFERQKRQKTLKPITAGVAVIEYEDGEREMIDMQLEKFRGYRPDSSDDERDDDTVDGDDDVNNFALIAEGEWIEILWRHTNMYFPCQVVTWTPLRARKPHSKKRAEFSSRKGVSDAGESSVGVSKQKDMKRSSNRPKLGNDATSRAKKKLPESGLIAQVKPAAELEQTELTQQMFCRNYNETRKSMENDYDDDSINSESSGLSDDFSDIEKPVERIGHGIPLFDEPEDDFDSSEDDESDSDEEDEGNKYPSLIQKGPQLSFEELWTLKLKRTKELMDRDSHGSNRLG